MPAEEDPAAMECREPVDSPQQFCLRWNNYQSNLTSSFDQLLQTQSFVDVTLSCDGQSLKAHKVVLSACSPYFQSLFMDNPCQHPIIIMRDTKYCDLKAAVDFMYRGEINVSQEQIPALLKVAESLKIRGLTDVSGEHAVVQEGARRKRERRPGEPESPAPAKRRPSEERAPSPPAADLLPDTPAHPLPLHPDDVDIRPGIAEMIREEERSWQDKKSKTKNKLANIRRQSMLTGGGPPPEQLNEEDQLVLGTLSTAALVGHIDSNESIVEFIDLATPSTAKAPMCMAPPGPSGSRDVQDVILCDPLTSLASAGSAAPPGPSGSRDVQDVILCDPQSGTSLSSVGAAAPRGTSASRGQSRKKTNAARRQQTSIDVAEKMTLAMEAKNDIKKKFYADFIKLMAQQTEALATIARSMQVKSSPYI